MNYNFDEIIDRKGTNSVKWDAVEDRWGRNDLIPMWVADMDFRTPPFVVEALRKRLEHEVLGYTFACKEWAESIINWLKERHGWTIREEMLTFTPGIVRGLAFAIQCFTEKGDKVMVMPPVYHPFFLVSQKNEREVVYSPLILRDGRYHIDFDRFRKDVQGCKLLILSNPHNPGGRVWTKEELSQIADICYDSGTLVISDEIHADLTLPPFRHFTFALISEKARMNSLVFMSPSKAFNMPGLASSYVIIENEEILHRFRTFMEASEFNEGHLFAYLSVAAAYSHGTEWLDQVIAYIKGNIDFTESYLKENIPAIKMIRPQASYLIFLDCRELGLTPNDLNQLFVEDAHLALNTGTTFGKEGEGFMRLNIACPRATLVQALEQLKEGKSNFFKRL
ncbi:MalY/PatB family protein [Bacteroides bouchesdurhonensis]|uniref:MalY/PatB family protein n=1 Tax=Bacteroides bouchesdurhonensis TaxID=1841855 RepID=UPI00097F823D|nr:PatB family C-S lyase [Bacteroides bouchesdurhonensis]